MIEKRTKTAVIGSPIDHSLSPTIHNYWIEKNNINAPKYQKIEVIASEIKQKTNEFLRNNFIGINVTIPLKEIAYNVCDETSETSKMLKAVNTISFKNSKIIGNNTDPKGFTNSINENVKNKNITNKNVLVIGAGGSARSIVYALNEMKAKVIVANRTLSKIDAISKDLKLSINKINFEEIQEYIPSLDMLINTTSLGMSDNINLNLKLEKTKPDLYVYDLVYKPALTKILQEAKINNLNFQNGLAMLVHQAAETFKIWHGEYPEITNELFAKLEVQ